MYVHTCFGKLVDGKTESGLPSQSLLENHISFRLHCQDCRFDDLLTVQRLRYCRYCEPHPDLPLTSLQPKSAITGKVRDGETSSAFEK